MRSIIISHAIFHISHAILIKAHPIFRKPYAIFPQRENMNFRKLHLSKILSRIEGIGEQD